MERFVQAQIASCGSTVHSDYETCRVIGMKDDKYLALSFTVDKVEFVGISSRHPTNPNMLFCSNVLPVYQEVDKTRFVQRIRFKPN